MDSSDVLLSVALDLTSSLTATDRYQRLLDAVRRVVPCDAACILRLEGDALVPLAIHGLRPDTLGRRYAPREHPRLQAIVAARLPTMFPDDSPMPDPFDGMLAVDPGARLPVHACPGFPLFSGVDLIGVLTADALAPGAFDGLDRGLLATVGAIAGAVLQTTTLMETLERTAERQGRIARDLMRDLALREGNRLIGQSPAMDRLRSEIEVVGRSNLPVLISGETGVGKELVAHALHAASPRQDEPMLYVNCAALPESLAESELFGHARGAFTGATTARSGKFEVADGGTLFLDEIGELPLSIQAKLLRALQEGEIQRIGEDRPLHVDVRVFAATNRDLPREVEAGRFRADLFHRLNVYPLRVPSLRERTQDIPLLAGYFCDLARRQVGLGPVRLDADTLSALTVYPWPGNVRELENVVSRAVLKASAGAGAGGPIVVKPVHLGLDFVRPGAGSATELPPDAEMPLAAGLGFHETVDEFRRTLIRQAVDARHGNWAAAARDLGLNRANLHHLARRLGL